MPAEPLRLLIATLGAILLTSVGGLIWRARGACRGTTLLLPWRWSLGALAVWLTAWLATMPAPLAPGIADQLWFAAGVAGLCPPLAVLGARKPMSQIWSVFILVPLLLVFSWPAVSDWSPRFTEQHWQLEEPVCFGFCIVLLMGLGNYAGTRYALTSFLFSLALVLVVLPLCPPVQRTLARWLAAGALRWPDHYSWYTRALAVLSLGVGAGWGYRAARIRQAVSSSLDALWLRYREQYGLVWAKRLQDRFNYNARNAEAAVRLFPTGFRTTQGEETVPAESLSSEDRRFTEFTMRWLLRRFVEPEWIDIQLADIALSSSGERGPP